MSPMIAGLPTAVPPTQTQIMYTTVPSMRPPRPAPEARILLQDPPAGRPHKAANGTSENGGGIATSDDMMRGGHVVDDIVEESEQEEAKTRS